MPTTAASGFKMTPSQFKAAITPRSKLVMINSPSNPTGSVYTREELAALAEVALAHNVGVISDEIYEQLVYGNAKATCFATLLPKLADRVITISGNVTGNVHAVEKLELKSSGTVNGNIATPRFAMADGATVTGKVKAGPGN